MRWWVGVVAGVTFVACSSFEAGESGAPTPPSGTDAGPDAISTTATGDASVEAGPAGSSCPSPWFCDDFETGNLERWDGPVTGRTQDTVEVTMADRPGAPAGNHVLHLTTPGISGDAPSDRIDAYARKVQPVVPGGTLATRAWVRFGTTLTPLVYTFLMTGRRTSDGTTQFFLDGAVLNETNHWGLQSDHTGRDYDGAFDPGFAKPNEWTCLELEARLAPEDAIGRVRLFVNDRLVAERARSTVDAVDVGQVTAYELWAGIARPGPTVAGDLFLDDIAFAHFADDPSGDAPRIRCAP